MVIKKPQEPESMSLLLACAPASSNIALTRLADDVVQLNEAASYRLITDVHVFAIKDGAPVNATVDHRQSSVLKPDKTQFYHFGYCNMPKLTNNCLVYAKAMDVDQETPEATLKYNGSLNAVMSDVTSTADIYFEPVSIYSDVTVIPTHAWDLADALTAIVNDSHNEGNTLVWKTSQNSILRNLFQRFTNSGADLPGSAASVKQWMLSLSNAAHTYLSNSPASLGENEKTLLGIIETNAKNAANTENLVWEAAGDYPRDINLPDGAAALRWTEVEEQQGENVVKVQKFVPQMQTTTLDDINSVSRFVYPPALYYFVNSGLWTSIEALTFDNYKDRSTWKGTGNTAVQTLFSDGGTVLSNTKTVAIADPLQYAVAHLTMEVKADAASLPYEDGNENKIAINDLTLKGVIIGGQRSVGYDFKPISDSQYDINFVYDSQVSSSTPLTTTGDTYNTLALQSYDGEKVNIILEFQYSGDTGFKCLNGYVYPGTRFYLVGELDPSQGVPLEELTDEEKAELKKRVFTQDHTTAIQLTVNSLEKAYNVLPSLLSNSLEIGVMITPQWFSATPSGPVVME